MRKSAKVSTPGSRLHKDVLDVLQSEGYIRGYSTAAFDNGRSEFEIELKYYDGQPVIREIQRVSKPGLRRYVATGSIPRVLNGMGIAILSTNVGLLTDREARQRKVGGEVLCQVW